MTTETTPTSPKNDNHELLEALHRVVVRSNWRLPPSKLPHLLVHSAGTNIDEIAAEFVHRIQTQGSKGTSVAFVAEMANEPGASRPIRIVNRVQRGHVIATDVLLRRRHDDLYVRFVTHPRTMLTYLRWIWLGLIFLATLLSFLMAYLTITGAKNTWATDYAEKHARIIYPEGDKTAFLKRRILEGSYETDWVALRQSLRTRPELVAALNTNLSRSAVSESDSNIGKRDLGGMGVVMLIRMASQMREFSPDFIAEKMLLDTRNVDEYRLVESLDEIHSIKMGGMGVDRRRALFQTETVKEVALGEAVLSWASNSPEQQKEFLSIYDASTSWRAPWSLAQLFMADPRSALSNFGMPASLMAAAIGFFVWRAPLSWLRFPCWCLRWITPDDFNGEAMAANAGVKRVFVGVLSDRGITLDQMDDLGPVSQ